MISLEVSIGDHHTVVFSPGNSWSAVLSGWNFSLTYCSGSLSNFCGKLIPFWGQHGQNWAKSPIPGDLSVSWPNPNRFLACKSCHTLDIRLSSL
jgi:hypothetical protein